ncbi:hypothetical protein [Rhizobium leguminosarum]|uniref:hypothetical protein n=1 Tax=Rhizobium leguminosarum TaxID=384 RepID=UPI002E11EAD8|nr:hypothetical protein U8Q02_38790 [Rhizobium leguminosarum]
MSIASTDRIARRLRARQQALSTKSIQNAESRAIFGMAAQFKTNPDRRLDVTGLLAKPGFDEAFMMATPRIVREIPSFDLLSFKAKLASEASSNEFVAELSGGKVDGRADLFAVVLRGDLRAMEDFVQNADVFSVFGRTFKAAGLAHARSSVVLCPHLIDADVAGEVFPGQLRALAELLQMPLQDPDFPLSRAAADLLSAHRRTRASSTGLETRLVVGARVRIVPVGSGFEEDGLSPDRLEAAGTDDVWSQKAVAALPAGVDASSPTSWNRACSRMAADELLSDLVLRAHARGMDMTGRFDSIHVCETEERLLVSATRGILSVGPSSTSATAAYADPVWFGDFLASIAESVHQKSAEGLMPHG